MPDSLRDLLSDIGNKVAGQSTGDRYLRVCRDANAEPPTNQLLLWGHEADPNPITGVRDAELDALKTMGCVSIEYFSQGARRCTLTRRGQSAMRDSALGVGSKKSWDTHLHRAYLISGVIVALLGIAGLVVTVTGPNDGQSDRSSGDTDYDLKSSIEVLGPDVVEPDKPPGSNGLLQGGLHAESSAHSGSSAGRSLGSTIETEPQTTAATSTPLPTTTSSPATSPQVQKPSTDNRGQTPATTTSETPPQPHGLHSTNQTRERVVLKWVIVDEASTYIIERLVSGSYQSIGHSTDNWHVDRELDVATSYEYRVIAVSATGETSEPSATLKISTQS